ncbi:MAG: hypothetical protein GY795_18090 [Desulfobacterales bacterium]|nr:hypothetical protein [Desulfobacterales bacterium]
MTKLKKLKHTDLLICIIFFGIQLGLQTANGAFVSEWGGHPDEAAHYVTGLMVRDYAASLELFSPMKFAENYYIHYPKVAIGHWPPVFYIIQAAWMLIFSHSRISIILLMAFLSTLLAGTLFLTVKKEYGYCTAILTGLLLIALPLTRKYSGMVMAEIPVALFSTWAVLCFGLFLDTEKCRWSLGFALFAVLAVLTKGNALALAMVPPLSLLFTRRFYLLSRMSFWYPALIVLALCGPWYWLTLDMVTNGWHKESVSVNFTIAAIPFFLSHFVKIVGIGLFLLIVPGFMNKIVSPYRKKAIQGKWAAFAALLVSVYVFHFIVPAGMENRHLLTAVPAQMMFFAAGISCMVGVLPRKLNFFRKPSFNLTQSRRLAMLTIAILGVFTWENFAIPGKEWHGFGEVAQRLVSVPDFKKSVVLISSDERGEGIFISEVAMREQRPDHMVFRASKVLSKSRWNGSEYTLLYRTPEEIMNFFEKLPLGIIVFDNSTPEGHHTEHHQLLKKTTEYYAGHWETIGAYPLMRKGVIYPDALEVYRLRGHENRQISNISVNMLNMLGRNIDKVF